MTTVSPKNVSAFVAGLRTFAIADTDAVQIGSASNSEVVRARTINRLQARATRIADEIEANPAQCADIVRLFRPELQNMDPRGLFLPAF